MKDEELAAELDELGAMTVGNVMLTTALASALIDAGAISLEQVVHTLRTFADLQPGSKANRPIEMAIDLLESSSGAFGHTETARFTIMNDLLRRLGRDSPDPAEGP